MNTWRKFRADDRGSMAVEFVLVTPILVWIIMSTFVYFDLFRNEANAHRAALTLADMFSREQTDIDGNYLNGARSLLQTLTLDDATPGFRITVYRYQQSDDTFRRVWSRNRGVGTNLTNADLLALQTAGRLPRMADDDRAILVETFTDYEPPFDTGIRFLTSFFSADGVAPREELDSITFRTFNVIRPRFTLSLCWEVPPPAPSLC
ncbi:TadE/TadG family type IV pilus assembly protein [Yoonia sp.]|uniref:TadE/TadG family type IV pilus assembly protein n=1 Tax=Yoonia sp. TaxID=2212373 RepID=UPI002FDAAE0F